MCDHGEQFLVEDVRHTFIDRNKRSSFLHCSAKQMTKEPKVHVAWAQGSRSRREAQVEEVMDSYTHFSTFALSGTNGTIRWHHLPADFKPPEVCQVIFVQNLNLVGIHQKKNSWLGLS